MFTYKDITEAIKRKNKQEGQKEIEIEGEGEKEIEIEEGEVMSEKLLAVVHKGSEG